MTDFEQTLFDAFKLAEASRKSAGLAPRKVSDMVRKGRGGIRRTGPSAYKVTLWLRPWHYADAMHAKNISNNPDQSLTKYLTARLEEAIAPVATRPTPYISKRAAALALRESKGADVVPLRKARIKSLDFAKAARNPYPEKIRAVK